MQIYVSYSLKIKILNTLDPPPGYDVSSLRFFHLTKSLVLLLRHFPCLTASTTIYVTIPLYDVTI